MFCVVVVFLPLSSFVFSLFCLISFFNSILAVLYNITYVTTGRITTFENTEEYYELFGLLLKVRKRVLYCCCCYCCYCYYYYCHHHNHYLIMMYSIIFFLFLFLYYCFYFCLFAVALCILIFVLFSLFVQDNKAENVEEKMNTTTPYSRPIISDNSLLPSPSPSSPPSTPSSTPSSSSSSSPLPFSPYSSPTPPSPLPLLSSSPPPLSLPFSSLYSFSSDSISSSFHHHNYREIAFEKIPSNYSYSLSNSTTYNTDLINKNNEYDNNNDNKKSVRNRQINENESNNTKTNKMKKSSKNRKTSFFHTNNDNNRSNKNKKNRISELGKQIFSIYFTDLNLEFLRKHGGGGNGIELLIKELSIAGSDSKNRKKSGVKIQILL